MIESHSANTIILRKRVLNTIRGKKPFCVCLNHHYQVCRFLKGYIQLNCQQKPRGKVQFLCKVHILPCVAMVTSFIYQPLSEDAFIFFWRWGVILLFLHDNTSIAIAQLPQIDQFKFFKPTFNTLSIYI